MYDHKDHWKMFFHWGHKVGLFFVLLLAVCIGWYYIQPAQRELHHALFELTFLGFTDMSWVNYLFAAVQCYIWGFIVVFLWKLVFHCPLCGPRSAKQSIECMCVDEDCVCAVEED